METNIVGIGMEIPGPFNDYALQKAEKIEQLAERAVAFQIKLTRQNERNGVAGEDKVELTLFGPGPLVRAESTGQDKFAVFDQAMAKLLERVRRAKDRRKVHRGRHRPPSVREASTDGRVADIVPASAQVLDEVRNGGGPRPDEEAMGEEEYSPVVIRKKVFGAARLSAEDAVDQMELVGHDFFLFIDSETDRASVVYRRKGWNYGVISLTSESESEPQPEGEADATASAKAQPARA